MNDNIGLEKDKLEIERNRLEIERERLQIEEMKSARRKGFFYRNFSTILPIVISFGSLVMAGATLYSSYAQKQQENIRLTKEKERDYAMQALKIVFENKEIILGEDTDRKEKAKILLEVVLPAQIHNEIFSRLQKSTSQKLEDREFWQKAQSIHPRVKATEKNFGYTFDIFLFLPEQYQGKIKEAIYTFNHSSFGKDNIKIGRQESDGFKVSYDGWGAIDDVDINIVLKDNTKIDMKLDMIKCITKHLLGRYRGIG